MTRADVLADKLEQVHSFFERNGIWHSLLFGTLLGAVRDGDVIEWDHDLDLLVRPSDVERIMSLRDEAAAEGLRFWRGKTVGYRLAMNPGRVALFDSAFLSIMGTDGSNYGELYAPSLFDDGVLRLYDFEEETIFWPQSSFPVFFVEELGEVMVRGRTYPAPAPGRAERLLELLYGDDWRVPYRSQRDGGEARPDRTDHGDVAEPDLQGAIEWCRAQGWDQTRYAAEPAWPRPLRGAGPHAWMEQTSLTTRSAWWHTLGELGARH